MASARRNEVVSEVIRARTRSPGKLWRTKTTRPSGPRPTHPPPAAIEPTTTSTTSSGTVCGVAMVRFLAPQHACLVQSLPVVAIPVALR